MRQAIIRFNIRVGEKEFALNEVVDFEPEDEQTKVMGLIRDYVKHNVEGGWMVKYIGDKKLMRKIMGYENDFYERDPRDRPAESWADFRCWGIRGGYLEIKELPEA